MFCMKLEEYKGRKVTEPDFWKNSWFGDICEKVSKLALVGLLVGWSVKRSFLRKGSKDFSDFLHEVRAL